MNKILIRARRHLDHNDFQQAALTLKKIDLDSLDAHERALYCIIYAEAQINLGRYDVDTYLHTAIEYFGQNRIENYFAHAKHLLGWAFITRGLHFDAREALLESYVTYKRLDDLVCQARVLNRLGFLSFQLGEIESALNYIEKCRMIYENLNEKNRWIIVSDNLGLLYTSIGSFKKSILTYKEIDPHLVKWNDHRNVCVHYIQSALPYGFIGKLNKAYKIIEKSLSFLERFPREQAIYYENLGWIHLLEEDYKSAEKALLKGLKISLDIAPKSALISQIKRRLGDAYLGLKKYDKAKKFADEAMVVAKNINERIEIAACHRVYAQLDVIDNNNSLAREWFGKAIDLFAMISSRYELAATRYMAASSGLYHNGERQALLYLAREYFESEEVRHYVEKVDREIERVRALPMPRPAAPESDEPTIIGGSRNMKRIIDLARHVALSDMNVLLTGATGTGKDLLARFIHYHSGRTGNFVSVNSAAIPDSMIESELFGYKKGAYTGADKATTGLIEEADGGTFYLNEIADASPELQAKLLDVIETRNVRRLGGRNPKQIDFRIIAATNHDLEKMMRDGKFRPDLYHRLNQIPLVLPPLSDRLDDIPALLEHFLALANIKLDGGSDSADITRLADLLSQRQWPGNVRQFEAEVNRLTLTSKGDLARMIRSASEYTLLSERDELLAVLEECNWNRREVARRLGVSEGAIRKRISKYNIVETRNA
jgi:DNA-binding NtrC family response regulator